VARGGADGADARPTGRGDSIGGFAGAAAGGGGEGEEKGGEGGAPRGRELRHGRRRWVGYAAANAARGRLFRSGRGASGVDHRPPVGDELALGEEVAALLDPVLGGVRAVDGVLADGAG